MVHQPGAAVVMYDLADHRLRLRFLSLDSNLTRGYQGDARHSTFTRKLHASYEGACTADAAFSGKAPH